MTTIFSSHTPSKQTVCFFQFLWRLLADCDEYFSPTENHKWNQRLSSSLKIVLPAQFLLSLTTYRIFEKGRLSALLICLCPHSEETTDLKYDFNVQNWFSLSRGRINHQMCICDVSQWHLLFLVLKCRDVKSISI